MNVAELTALLTPVALPASAVVGYLLGSIPFGLVLTRLAGLGDVRAIGSGNIGATNVLRTGRRDIALATLLLDGAKAGVALLLAQAIFASPTAGLVAGGAAFLGHCFPVWLQFKGGKGVATFFGVLFAAVWPVGLIAGATWLAMAFLFRFSSLGSLSAAAVAPVAAWTLTQRPDLTGFCVALAVLIFWRHRANIERLLKGEEPKIGSKK